PAQRKRTWPCLGEDQQCRLGEGVMRRDRDVPRTKEFDGHLRTKVTGATGANGRGQMQRRHAFGGKLIVRVTVGTAKEGLAEHAVTEEVHVLLEMDLIRRNAVEKVLNRGWKGSRDHCRNVRLAEVAQTVLGSTMDKLVEVQRIVVLLQVLMQHVGGG